MFEQQTKWFEVAIDRSTSDWMTQRRSAILPDLLTGSKCVGFVS